MNFKCEYTTPMDFEPLNSNPVSEFPLDPQFNSSLGEMREILEISVSVKAILIYAILNKTIIFSNISSRLVRISLQNFPRVLQNSTSLGEKVLSGEKLAISGRFYFCARKLTGHFMGDLQSTFFFQRNIFFCLFTLKIIDTYFFFKLILENFEI